VADLGWLLTGKGPRHRRDTDAVIADLRAAIDRELAERRALESQVINLTAELASLHANAARPWHSHLLSSFKSCHRALTGRRRIFLGR
jgi:hypothetical protein